MWSQFKENNNTVITVNSASFICLQEIHQRFIIMLTMKHCCLKTPQIAALNGCRGEVAAVYGSISRWTEGLSLMNDEQFPHPAGPSPDPL